MRKFLYCHRCVQIREHVYDVCSVCHTPWARFS